MLWRGCFEPLPLHSPCHIHPRCNVTCPETSLWAALPSLAGITLLFSWSGDLPKLSPLRVGEEPAGAKIRNFCTAAAEGAASRRKAREMTPARALGHPNSEDWIVSLNIVIVCFLMLYCANCKIWPYVWKPSLILRPGWDRLKETQCCAFPTSHPTSSGLSGSRSFPIFGFLFFMLFSASLKHKNYNIPNT